MHDESIVLLLVVGNISRIGCVAEIAAQLLEIYGQIVVQRLPYRMYDFGVRKQNPYQRQMQKVVRSLVGDVLAIWQQVSQS